MEWSGVIGLFLFFAEWGIRVGLAMRVILRRCPQPASLTWLVLLLFLPVISLFLYLLIGENRLGSRRASRSLKLMEQTQQNTFKLWQHQHMEWDPQSGCVPIARLLTNIAGKPALGGNALELMDDAGLVLDRLLADIDAAKHHCHLLFYIWEPAGRGLKIGHALIRAAKRGVRCRVLVDAVGAKKFLSSPLYTEMVQGGVSVVSALPVNPVRMLFARVDLRNHRKLAIIDGAIAYCGSQNLTDETFRNPHNKKVGPWIDATLRIQGPACQGLQTVFFGDWCLDCSEDFPTFDPYFPSQTRPGESVVHIVPSGPGQNPEVIHQAFLSMIFAARSELVMTTPYFVPDEATKAALINAAMRGVDVTLVFPEMLDSALVAAAGRAHYEDLLAAGVKVLEHRHSLLHSKTMSVDKDMAVIGSANFDMRSFWINYELTLVVYDDDFSSELRFMQQKYIDESKQIFFDDWIRRPVLHRLRDHAAALLGPLL